MFMLLGHYYKSSPQRTAYSATIIRIHRTRLHRFVSLVARSVLYYILLQDVPIW